MIFVFSKRSLHLRIMLRWRSPDLLLYDLVWLKSKDSTVVWIEIDFCHYEKSGFTLINFHQETLELYWIKFHDWTRKSFDHKPLVTVWWLNFRPYGYKIKDNLWISSTLEINFFQEVDAPFVDLTVTRRQSLTDL